MPALIRESDMLKVAAMLVQLAQLDDTKLPSDLEADEITLVVDHRRQKLHNALMNKGIEVRADPPPATVTGDLGVPGGVLRVEIHDQDRELTCPTDGRICPTTTRCTAHGCQGR